jgi:ribonuclease BN (tRNA processing enzyme)
LSAARLGPSPTTFRQLRSSALSSAPSDYPPLPTAPPSIGFHLPQLSLFLIIAPGAALSPIGVVDEQIVDAESVSSFFQRHMAMNGAVPPENAHAALLTAIPTDSHQFSSPNPSSASILDADNPSPPPVLPFSLAVLGTGCSAPNKYRSVSSYLVDVPCFGTIFVDAGEGCLGQLVRSFGPNRALGLLANLRLLIITHLHGDHCFSIPDVIHGHFEAVAALAQSRGETVATPLWPLAVAGPGRVQYYLDSTPLPGPVKFFSIASIEDPVILPQVVALQKHIDWLIRTANVESAATPCLRLTFAPAQHEPPALAVRFDLTLPGYRSVALTFSGDSGPCNAIASLASGSAASPLPPLSVLVHEASFALDPPGITEARSRGHSCVGDALAVAAIANVDYLITTHFSQRYGPLPPRMLSSEPAAAVWPQVAALPRAANLSDMGVQPDPLPRIQWDDTKCVATVSSPDPGSNPVPLTFPKVIAGYDCIVLSPSRLEFAACVAAELDRLQALAELQPQNGIDADAELLCE